MNAHLDAREVPPLAPDDVHVWQVALDAEPGETRCRRLAHRYLRRLLASYLGVEPRTLPFVVGRHGKPALESGSLGFNIAHSGDVALVAVAQREVGVDVERIEPARAFGPIADRLFAPAEAEVLRGLPTAERIRVFYLLWTRKEAYAKATGRGLSQPLRSLRVHPRLATPDAERWCLCDLELDVDLAAALCVEAPVDRVRLFRLGPRAAR